MSSPVKDGNSVLAYAAGSRILQTHNLENSLAADEDMSVPLHCWQSLSGLAADDIVFVCGQRVLDYVVVGHMFYSLVNNQMTKDHRTRLLDAAAAHSGDWLHVVPILACGLLLNDEAVAVGLRFGSEICQPYHCV